MSKYLAVSLIIVAFVFGIGFGYVLTPGYKTQDLSMTEMNLGRADKYLDLRYLNAMIAHHKSAMLLAERIKDQTQRKEIKDLASMIFESEPKAIAELETWKWEWYSDRSSVQASQVPNLGTFDEKVDLRFLNALIAHHEAGIKMVNEIKTKSSRNDVLNNADAVGTFLSGSIVDLKKWREEWYQI